jgi:hypothetical protein
VAIQRAAQIQVLLEGVPLPASKQTLIDYARAEDARAVEVLEAIPDREYRSLDEVGEALSSVQPSWSKNPGEPREESDLPPGGDDYTRPYPESGAVRPRSPGAKPPQQVIEKQAETQKKQQESG